ncbi:MAG TPA: hemolysin, partial [Gammaproteobacteria bacterium]|nr:hemolysin [Gammaproteobacteria bacterium]
MYIFGQNSWLFHFASWLGEPLRMATLIHEALKMRGDTVRFKIG